MTLWLPAFSLAWREVIRFYRQRSRVVGALLSPLLFWLVIGSGFGRSFRFSGSYGYLEYFYPGTLVMILLFTAIFSTISLIEDRREGFLQGVMASPASRSSIVLGKTLGATILATLQGALFLLLAPFIGISLTVGSGIFLILLFLIVSFGLTVLGFLIAWRMKSIQGFHAIMNLLLMPMWLLSGAVFPVSAAPGWMGLLMKVNPVTYGVAVIRRGLFGSEADYIPMPGMGVSLIVLVGFALVLFATALVQIRRKPMAV